MAPSTKVIGLRVTEALAGAWESAAQAAGVPVSSFLVDRITRFPVLEAELFALRRAHPAAVVKSIGSHPAGPVLEPDMSHLSGEAKPFFKGSKEKEKKK